MFIKFYGLRVFIKFSPIEHESIRLEFYANFFKNIEFLVKKIEFLRLDFYFVKIEF